MLKEHDIQRRHLAKFRSISTSRIAELRRQLSDFLNGSQEDETRATLRRELHTLKGESRMMGFGEITQTAHGAESVLSAFFADPDESILLDELRAGLDLLTELCECPTEIVPELLARSQAFVERASAYVSAQGVEPAGRTSATEPGVASGPRDRAQKFLHVPLVMISEVERVVGALGTRQDEMDRVVSDAERILERWLRETGRSRVRQTDRSEAGLRRRLEALGRELLSTLQRARDESFECRLQARDLRERLQSMRLSPLDGLLDRQALSARQLARSQGKSVLVSTEGHLLTVDEHMIDQLGEPVLHLVRNAIDHGLETEEDRIAAGKPAEGHLKLLAREVGGALEFVVEDDGRGVDPAIVRKKAVEKGLIDEHQSEELSDDAVFKLLFSAGFSTRESATELSGRGVGLESAVHRVAQMKGTIEIDSRLGQGTQFTLRVPLLSAFDSVLLVSVRQQLFALPSNSVVSVSQLPREQLDRAGGHPTIQLGAKRLRLYHLRDALGLESDSNEGASVRVVVVETKDDQYAFEVDSINGEHQLVRSRMNEFLSNLSIFRGSAMLPGGRVVLFVDPVELSGRIGNSLEAGGHGSVLRSSRERRRILVVDDSPLTREMLVSLVGRSGFDVSEAQDGDEALGKLSQHKVDLVLTDLDMPVLDGFELVARLRAQPETSQLPVVVFSMRGDDADRQRAMNAGASAFVVKSRFREKEFRQLLELHLTSGRD